MEEADSILPKEALSPEGINFITWLMSQVRDTNSPLAAAANLDIGLALKEQLPWIDDPDLDGARRRLLEVLARLALSLSRNTFEIGYLRCTEYLLDKAMEGCDPGDDESLARLRQLHSQVLFQRFLRDPRGPCQDTLDQAIDMAEHSVRRTEMMLLERKLDLWICLHHKARSTDGDEAIAFSKRSVLVAELVYNTLKSNKSQSRSLWLRALNSMSLSYQAQSEITPEYNDSDLERAIEYGAELCQALPPEADQPAARVEALANLSILLLRAYGRWVEVGTLPSRLGYQDGEGLIVQAVHHLEESIETLCERPRSHLENALTFVLQIDKIPKQVQAAALGRISGVLKTCIDRMREIALYASREDLLENMGTFYGLSRFAAAAALEAGATAYDALKLLDEGRGISLSIQLDSRVDDTRLGDADAELRGVYTETRQRLLASVKQGISLHERHDLVRRLLDLQRQIGARVPNFETCPSLESLVAMAKEATIVVVNVTEIRSDAFIISGDGARVERLPAVDEQYLSETSFLIQAGLNDISDDDVSRATVSRMTEALKILWKTIVHPVLKAIGKGSLHCEGKPWPRVCWIPTGVLGLYPIHAAGPYRATKPEDAGTISRVISSYAPTLKILHKNYSTHRPSINSLDGAEPLSGPIRSLKAAVIAESKPPSDDSQQFAPLAAAERGTEIIRRTFSTVADDNTSLLIPHPTEPKVLELLRRDLPLVQFFCHGNVDYDEPLNSTLFLEDWQTSPLTVGTLMTLDLRRSQLAFLSACWGAHSGVENLQDEINHLACGLQAAGFANVVGSLWEAVEEDMIELMTVFYGLLGATEGGLTSGAIGEALHAAVLKVRETSCEVNPLSNPIRWAPFMRFGL